MKKIPFIIKQIFKMFTQNALLPVIYLFWRVIYTGKKPELIIFADAHHDTLPISMEYMHKKLEDRGFELMDSFCDYESMSAVETFVAAARFMRPYVRASHVFICDNFLPVSSCPKRKETKVIQLWHACGALKKMGYDAPDDIPTYYVGNIYKNYDLVTVSAPYAVPAFTGAMRQKPGVVCATGVSRTDIYFDQTWRKGCRDRLLLEHPEAAGKKVILWAPTFRGNAASPYGVGFDEITTLERELGEGYLILKKVHPHMEKSFSASNSRIPTEELLVSADLLITDYSSILFDCVLLGRPFILFAPDLEDYMEKRGFYMDYENMSPWLAKNSAELKAQVTAALDGQEGEKAWISGFREQYLSACDGYATERILHEVGLNERKVKN